MNCDCVPSITKGFQGGLCSGEVCGAASGAVLGLGMLYGAEQPETVKPRTKEFMKSFAESQGSVRCFDLIDFDINAATSGDDFWEVMKLLWFFTKGGKKICNGAIRDSVQMILNPWLEETT